VSRKFYYLDLDGALESLALLQLSSIGFGTHDTTTPLTLALLVLGSVSLLDGGDELGELGLVFGADFGESEDGSSLLVNDRTETSLALDYGVWDTHLAAESGEEDDKLNWVNIVGDEDQRSLLVLNQTNDVVQSVLDSVWFLADILGLLTLLDSGSLLQETFLLLRLGFRAVLVEELEGLGGQVTVKNVLELSDGRWNLQAHVEDLLLALKTDILGPSNHARQVTLWLDVLTDTEVASTLLNERVLGRLL